MELCGHKAASLWPGKAGCGMEMTQDGHRVWTA
jgi:hypothetical protein